MSSPLQEKAKFQAISTCFLKLAALNTKTSGEPMSNGQALFGSIAKM
jgi:hypothetical protein